MRWRLMAAGVLATICMAGEAFALSDTQLQETAAATTPPAEGPNLVLPPHLPGGVPPPHGWAPPLQALPTLQDLAATSPTYTAPPPGRHGR